MGFDLFVLTFILTLRLFVSTSHFDPHIRFKFFENIRMPAQLNGSTSIVKLSLQSSIFPDSHWSPIELGLLILKPFLSFSKSLSCLGKANWSHLSVSFQNDGNCVVNDIWFVEVEVICELLEVFWQQKRTSKFSHWFSHWFLHWFLHWFSHFFFDSRLEHINLR